MYDQIVAVLKLGIQTDQVMTLAGTYTFPEYRQQGYAQQLVSYAVNLILKQKKIAHLIVDQDNFAAVYLYKKTGFMIVDRAHVCHLDE